MIFKINILNILYLYKMENIIGYIRNILRKEGISGMDSINHCIAFIVCRILDDDLCEKVNIDKKFSYDNINAIQLFLQVSYL